MGQATEGSWSAGYRRGRRLHRRWCGGRGSRWGVGGDGRPGGPGGWDGWRVCRWVRRAGRHSPPVCHRRALASQPLPAGWILETDADGYSYYVNTLTEETQWERPTAPAVGADGTVATATPDPVAVPPDGAVVATHDAEGNVRDLTLRALASGTPDSTSSPFPPLVLPAAAPARLDHGNRHRRVLVLREHADGRVTVGTPDRASGRRGRDGRERINIFISDPLTRIPPSRGSHPPRGCWCWRLLTARAGASFHHGACTRVYVYGCVLPITRRAAPRAGCVCYGLIAASASCRACVLPACLDLSPCTTPSTTMTRVCGPCAA